MQKAQNGRHQDYIYAGILYNLVDQVEWARIMNDLQEDQHAEWTSKFVDSFDFISYFPVFEVASIQWPDLKARKELDEIDLERYGPPTWC